MNAVDLSVEIAGIKMNNPIMPASGCFGYGEEFDNITGFDSSRLGAIVSKGTTIDPKEGNLQPRIWETPNGMINRIGLENPGLNMVIKEKIPFMLQFGVPVIINISGNEINDFAVMAAELDKVEGNIAIEENISCPNVHGGNLPFGSDPKIAGKVTSLVRKVTKKIVIVKLTPNVSNISEIAKAVEDNGADAISLINTLKGSFIHKGKRVQGGLSGPAIKPVALTLVAEVLNTVKIPVIGMGGIETVADTLEFIKLGCHAVAVGTANFSNPLVMMELIDGLEKYCQKNQINNLSQIRGTIK